MKVFALAGFVAISLAMTAPQAAGQSPRSRLCPDDLPEGVRLPPQRGCDADPVRAKPRPEGLHDFGNGTTVRIGGRTATEFGVRR